MNDLLVSCTSSKLFNTIYHCLLTSTTAICKPNVASIHIPPATFYHLSALACGFSYPHLIPNADFSACCTGTQHFYNDCFHWFETDENVDSFARCLERNFEFLDEFEDASQCNRNTMNEGGRMSVRRGSYLGVVVVGLVVSVLY